jgi:hypothetical protein
MHQWGYRHQSNVNTTMPRIIGSCMETIMNRSASCTTTCAGLGQIPVSRFTTSTCSCVDDPRFDVGVIPDINLICPVLPGRAVSDDIVFFMDNEDDAGSVNSSASGWIGFQSVSSAGNSTLRFCRAPGRAFGAIDTASSGQHYAVARMGTTCPAGSSSFFRTWDNEDTNNDNFTRGHLPPHVQRKSDGGSYTTIEYCIFRGNTQGTSAPWPSVSGLARYGVLGPSNLFGALATGEMFTDDENTSNSNALGGSTSGTNVFLTATSGGNTTLRFARVR